MTHEHFRTIQENRHLRRILAEGASIDFYTEGAKDHLLFYFDGDYVVITIEVGNHTIVDVAVADDEETLEPFLERINIAGILN